MLLQSEIINVAKARNVKTATIDKDWVLAHFLNAIFSVENIEKILVFKGGTCLKKCYFEDYRFSEDLDFTLLDKSFEINENLINRIIRYAEKTSGAKFHFERKKIQMFNDIEQGCELEIKYWGADHKPNQKPLPPSRWQTKIKIDISFSEKLITSPVFKPILHNYTDKKMINQIVPAYSLIEIISEKIRALLQRNRPRDIYDIWFLSNTFSFSQYQFINELLNIKAKNKNIEIADLNSFINEDKGKKIKRAWHKSLGGHLPEFELPDFDKTYQEVYIFIKNILNS